MAIKICLDAGHDGKYNKSNVVPTYYESDFNWKLYVKLKKYLEDYGITVISTRDNQNVEMGTKTRGRKAKGCDAFLSLHANWAERESADHVVIYEMLTKKKHKFAVALAKTIQEVMGTKEAYDIRTRAKDDGGEYYGVLQGCVQVDNDSGFILEHSFYSNKAMATWMMKDSNIDKLAKAEADTIATYFGVSAPTSVKTTTFKTGDLVSIKSGAVYTTGTKIPSWVRKQNWYIKSISGSIAIIDQNEAKNNNISSPVDVKYLTLVKAATKETTSTTKPATKTETVRVEEPSVKQEVEVPKIEEPSIEIEVPKENPPAVIEPEPEKSDIPTLEVESVPVEEPEIEEFIPPVEEIDEDDDNGPEAEVDNIPMAANAGEALLKLLVEFIINPLVNLTKGLFSKGK